MSTRKGLHSIDVLSAVIQLELRKASGLAVAALADFSLQAEKPPLFAVSNGAVTAPVSLLKTGSDSKGVHVDVRMRAFPHTQVCKTLPAIPTASPAPAHLGLSSPAFSST